MTNAIGAMCPQNANQKRSRWLMKSERASRRSLPTAAKPTTNQASTEKVNAFRINHQTSGSDAEVVSRPPRHRYCCVRLAMRQTTTATISPTAARSKFAWFSNGIPEVLRPGGYDGLPVKPGPCPASPIFGHASPIMDRRLAAARECQSDGLRTIPFPRQSREPHGRSKHMSTAALNFAGQGLNAFFAISVNSPSLSMVNVSCCVCSALVSGARGVTRRVTPQPMRAAVRMEAGADACL
jgi:hypothetical protein